MPPQTVRVFKMSVILYPALLVYFISLGLPTATLLWLAPLLAVITLLEFWLAHRMGQARLEINRREVLQVPVWGKERRLALEDVAKLELPRGRGSIRVVARREEESFRVAIPVGAEELAQAFRKYGVPVEGR